MQNEKFSNVASELDEIFKYLDKDILAKIPQDLKKQIAKSKNPNYKYNIEKNKDFEEQELMEETKQILAVIFVEYCCDDSEKLEIFEAHKELEKIKNETKIGLDIFEHVFNENTQNDIFQNSSQEIVSVENIPWYKKIISKIKMIFK